MSIKSNFSTPNTKNFINNSNIDGSLTTIYVNEFKTLPSNFTQARINPIGFDDTMEILGFEVVSENIVYSDGWKEKKNFFEILVNTRKQSIVYVDHNHDGSIEITVYYNILYPINFSLLRILPKPLVDEDHTYEIGILLPTSDGLRINKFNLDFDEIPLSNYSDEIISGYDKMVNDLKIGNKGLNIFSGEPGTGKTNFIKKLAHDLKDSKLFVFINADNAEILGSPHLTRTLVNHRSEGLILVIEDGESSIAKRSLSQSERSKFTTNLLNITDGIMSDLLKTQVIITHNTEVKDNIDEAFIRNGRLKSQKYFGPLSIEKSNEWLTRHGVDSTITKPTKLCDLYEIVSKKG